MKSAQGGSGARFGELYTRMAPAVYTWARLRIRPSLQAQLDPEDIVQEVWCRALRGLDGFDPARGSFRRWIFGIAYRVLYLALQGLGERSPGDGDGYGARDRPPPLPLTEIPDEVTSITRKIARSEWVAAFARVVAGLSEQERELILRRGIEGRGLPQVARMTGVPLETTKKRWQRLRAKVTRWNLPQDLLLG